MGSHSVTLHATQVNTPRLNPRPDRPVVDLLIHTKLCRCRCCSQTWWPNRRRPLQCARKVNVSSVLRLVMRHQAQHTTHCSSWATVSRCWSRDSVTESIKWQLHSVRSDSQIMCLLPLSGTHFLTAFVSVNSGNTFPETPFRKHLKTFFIANWHSLSPLSDPLPQRL